VTDVLIFKRALDILGACLIMCRTQDDDTVTDLRKKKDWLSITQYSIAVILFAKGNLRDALEVCIVSYCHFKYMT